MHALERLRSAVRKVFVLSLVDRRIYIDETCYPRHRLGVESRPPRQLANTAPAYLQGRAE